MRYAILTSISLLSACASPAPISSSPTQDIAAATAQVTPGGPSLGGTIEQGLLDASFNFDNAVTVGALDAQDAAPPCLHSVLKQIGIDPANPTPAAASFTPKISEGFSSLSVAYIRARQGERLAGTGVTISQGCLALIGQIVVDGSKAAVQASGAPGVGGLINSLLPVPLK